MSTFDLAASPWIPLRAPDGTLCRASLRDALARAHEWVGVEHPIPIVEAGLWRLLVAVALDAFAPADLDELLALLERGRFDEAVLDAYLARHREAFDLFSVRRPFLQDASADGETKPVAALLPCQPSGTNVTHWHHGHEDDFAVSPAEAACLLASIAPFMTAGGAGLAPSINGAPPWYAMPDGPSLFHAVALNLWVTHPARVKRGVPAWRDDRAVAPGTRRTSATLLESLTWRPRRVRLLPGEGGRCALSGEEVPVLVRRMHFTAGDACDFPWIDPNVAYVLRKDKRVPLRPSEDRAPWRDVGALALLRDARDARTDDSELRIRPAIVGQFEALSREAPEVVGGALRLRLYGMRTDLKMKVFEWHRQTLELPVPLILRERLQIDLVKAVEQAEDASDALRREVTRAVTIGARAPDAASQALIRLAARRFWSDLEEPFRELARRLGAVQDVEAGVTEITQAREGWRASLARAARAAFATATDTLRLDAARLVAMERARAQLEGTLRLALQAAAPADRGASSRKRSRRAS